MKLAVIITDGMADEKPFNEEIFFIAPSLGKLNSGLIETNKAGFSSETTSCVLNILGAEEKAFFVGRSYFELLSLGKTLGENQSSLRLNLVTTNSNGTLTSFNAINLTENKQKQIMESLHNFFPNIFPLSSYRAVAVFEKENFVGSSLNLSPHENLFKNYNDLVAENIGENNFLKEEIQKINNYLSSFKIGKEDLKIFPYSKQEQVSLKNFEELYNKKASIICDFETVFGIGKALGIETVFSKTLSEKRNSLETLLKREDLDICFLHINDLDELSHNKDLKGKKDFITKIEKEIFSHLKSYNIPFIILSDHITSCKTGAHSNENVPFYTNLNLENHLTTSDLKSLYKSL